MPRPHWLFWAGYWLLLLSLPGLVIALRQAPGEGRPPVIAPARRLLLKKIAAPGALALCGLIFMAWPLLRAQMEQADAAVELRLLDVGQGQAVLLEWTGLGADKQKGRVLVDGGGSSSPFFDIGRAVLAPVLTREAMPRVQLVINTHPDSDHLGGLIHILSHFQVGEYWGNGDTPQPALAARQRQALARSGLVLRTLGRGEALQLAPGLSLETLWPTESARERFAGAATAEKGNDASLVLRLVWQGRPLALLCGDVEAGALEELTALSGGECAGDCPALRAQVLVLPHHGSASSLYPSFYEAVRPGLALVSSGYANRWALPRKAVREAMAGRGIPLLNTADVGQIRLRWSAPDALPHVQTARHGQR